MATCAFGLLVASCDKNAFKGMEGYNIGKEMGKTLKRISYDDVGRDKKYLHMNNNDVKEELFSPEAIKLFYDECNYIAFPEKGEKGNTLWEILVDKEKYPHAKTEEEFKKIDQQIKECIAVISGISSIVGANNIRVSLRS